MAEAYSVNTATGGIALVAGTPKTVLGVKAGSTQPFRFIQLAVSCNSKTAGLLKVEMLVGTTTSGTTTTAPTIARMNGEAFNKAAISTAVGFSVEPTYAKYTNNGTLVIKTLMFVTPTGPYDIEYPLGREFYCPVTNGVYIRLTSTTVSPTVWVNVCFEE
jgi:hypothetical protein